MPSSNSQRLWKIHSAMKFSQRPRKGKRERNSFDMTQKSKGRFLTIRMIPSSNVTRLKKINIELKTILNNPETFITTQEKVQGARTIKNYQNYQNDPEIRWKTSGDQNDTILKLTTTRKNSYGPGNFYNNPEKVKKSQKKLFITTHKSKGSNLMIKMVLLSNLQRLGNFTTTRKLFTTSLKFSQRLWKRCNEPKIFS